MRNPNPTCEKECCRFSYGNTFSTAMGWSQVYDKHGNLVSEDPNIHTSEVHCSTCNKTWISRTQYGKTEYKEVN